MVDVDPQTDDPFPMQKRSSYFFPSATVDQSGSYVCHVHDSIQDQRNSASINITVLGRGSSPAHRPSSACRPPADAAGLFIILL